MAANLEQVGKRMQQAGFDVQVLTNTQAVIDAVRRLIPNGASVGFGGSVTAKDMKLDTLLRDAGHRVYWHWDVPHEQQHEVRAQAFQADWYILSANALTQNGEIVNTDGTGNRLVGSFYGPRDVIFIIGRNKLTDDLISARERVQYVAAPLNGRRLQIDAPCAQSGECSRCSDPCHMCAVTTIIEKPTPVAHMHVLLVDEDLGY